MLFRSYDEIPKATQDEVFSGAKAFVKENKGRYEYTAGTAEKINLGHRFYSEITV